MRGRGQTVRFRVAGEEYAGRRGASLLEALGRQGFEVPALCQLSGLAPYGACRLCLVEVQREGRRRLTTACNYPLQDGLEVWLDTAKVVRHRRVVLELLLAMAPGSSELSGLARRWGVERSRFEPRTAEDNCILCALCVRVCRETVRAEALALAGRGARKALARSPFGEFPESCIGCGACAFVCPTRAISMEPTAVARMRERWGRTRPCRYALMGLAPGSVCENDYDCKRCEVDQRMVDRARGRHPIFLTLGRGEAEP